MDNMTVLAKTKAETLTRKVITDPRWDIQDELLCQVFGFTMYGYVFGVGRLACFMDVQDIQQLATDQLTGLGIGSTYAQGMMQSAYEIFMDKGNSTIHSQLIGIGHSHFASEDMTDLVESIFVNTEKIKKIMS